MIAKLLLLACALGVASAKVFYEERFGAGWEDRWVKSEWKDDMGTWGYGPGEWFAEGQEENAKGIITMGEVKNHAISAKMSEAASTTGSGKVGPGDGRPREETAPKSRPTAVLLSAAYDLNCSLLFRGPKRCNLRAFPASAGLPVCVCVCVCAAHRAVHGEARAAQGRHVVLRRRLHQAAARDGGPDEVRRRHQVRGDVRARPLRL